MNVNPISLLHSSLEILQDHAPPPKKMKKSDAHCINYLSGILHATPGTEANFLGREGSQAKLHGMEVKPTSSRGNQAKPSSTRGKKAKPISMGGKKSKSNSTGGKAKPEEVSSDGSFTDS